jgi:hypothetical protein
VRAQVRNLLSRRFLHYEASGYDLQLNRPSVLAGAFVMYAAKAKSLRRVSITFVDQLNLMITGSILPTSRATHFGGHIERLIGTQMGAVHLRRTVGSMPSSSRLSCSFPQIIARREKAKITGGCPNLDTAGLVPWAMQDCSARRHAGVELIACIIVTARVLCNCSPPVWVSQGT